METNSKKNTDLTYLKELSNGSNEFIVQMITIFLNETPAAVDKVEQYAKTSNWDALRAAVHKMKPSTRISQGQAVPRSQMATTIWAHSV